MSDKDEDMSSNAEVDKDSRELNASSDEDEGDSGDEGSGTQMVSAVEITEEPDDDASVLADADDRTVQTHDEEERSDDGASTASPSRSKSSKKRASPASASRTGRKGRTPSVAGLTIPFRTVKKAMKLDPDTPIVQNEAAIMTTLAAEKFMSMLAKESFRSAKLRGRNTIRYEDVAEARTKNASMSFLETLLP